MAFFANAFAFWDKLFTAKYALFLQGGGVSGDREDFWTTFDQPYGIPYECEVTKIQQLLLLPQSRSDKLFHPEVEKRGKLYVPAFPSGGPAPRVELGGPALPKSRVTFAPGLSS
ncbi:1227_t:CDS:2 [Gigaspora rosea]|nr:1227_t:CDS:2 [Gigaspora rosea]